MVDEAQLEYRRLVNSGHFNIETDALDRINSKKITNGLKFALATGNWNADRTAGVRTGVSQVSSNLFSPLTVRQLGLKMNESISSEKLVSKNDFCLKQRDKSHHAA